METIDLGALLAQAPQGAAYVSAAKLLTFGVLFAIWAAFAQWVDKDTVAVNTYRSAWNMATTLCGAGSLILLILLPIFWAALGAFVVANVALMIFYVLHRNALVVEDDKVCTASHFKKLMARAAGKDAKKKKKLIDVRERVRITGADRKVIKVPEEPEEREVYAALQDLLFDALLRHANQIEVVPAGQVSKLRVTIDGAVQDREPVERTLGESILAFFKKAAGLNPEERRKPQKGRLVGAIADNKYELIVSTSGSTAGETLAIRVLGDERGYRVVDLGFTMKQLDAIKTQMSAETGLVLFSAPAGGGLSTTLYSMARSHDAFLENIQLVEYDNDIQVENITQKLFVPGDERTFAGDLLKMTRTDPDIIIAPEIRDRESALVASEGAKKFLVYVGIKSWDIFEALQRWSQMVNDAGMLANSLAMVVHQRLVRKLCTTCKAAYKPDAATLKKINLPADKVLHRPPEPQVDKHGQPIVCSHCFGVGYLGRTAIYSLLAIDEELRGMIKRNVAMSEIKAAALKKGGLNLQQIGLQKVLDGVTSIDEVARATRPPQVKAAS